MTAYRLICPRCGTKIITATPEEATWELCPGCFRHAWDLLDARMAEPVTENYRQKYSDAEIHLNN